MLKRFSILALLVAFVAVNVNAQTHRRRGALLGGLAGAAIGAAIGDKGNNETAGALIGGAVGAVAGSSIGAQKDARIQHNQVYHSGHHYTYPVHPQPQPQPYYPPTYVQPAPQPVIVAPRQPGPVTPEDVVAMARSGLSEAMIIQQIQYNGVLRPLTVSEVIQMHQLGVSEPIITAMQNTTFLQQNGQQPYYGPEQYGQPSYPQVQPQPTQPQYGQPTIIQQPDLGVPTH